MLSSKPKVEAYNSYLVCRCCCCSSQTPFNTDTEEAKESDGIKGKSVLSGSFY